LFLILVTDLPPSIALGMEPGDSTILEDRPRPKDEPVVLNWMWVSMIMNGAVLSAVIIAVYIIALISYCDGQVFQTDIYDVPDFADKLMDARTVAFISLVWAENVRSYTSRSFSKPIWHNLLGNVNMQKAIIMAQICLYMAVLVPFFSTDILQLRGVNIGIFGWLLALLGPVGCLVLCELCKLITAFQMSKYQDSLQAKHAAEDKRLAAAAASRQASSGGAPPPSTMKAAAPPPQFVANAATKLSVSVAAPAPAVSAPAAVKAPVAVPVAAPAPSAVAVATKQEATVKLNIQGSITIEPSRRVGSRPDGCCLGVSPVLYGSGARYSCTE